MDPWDLLVVLGLGVLSTGLWFLAPWLALIVLGCLLLAAGLLGGRMAELRALATERRRSN